MRRGIGTGWLAGKRDSAIPNTLIHWHLSRNRLSATTSQRAREIGDERKKESKREVRELLKDSRLGHPKVVLQVATYYFQTVYNEQGLWVLPSGAWICHQFDSGRRSFRMTVLGMYNAEDDDAIECTLQQFILPWIAVMYLGMNYCDLYDTTVK